MYKVTKIAAELVSLASFEPDQEYLDEIASLAISQGATFVNQGVVNENTRDIVGLRLLRTRDEPSKG